MGNICRSPFAEHFARSCLPVDRVIRSAGYHPEGMRCCPELAIARAATWEVDLGDHRSQVINDDLIRAAQAIFVFDEQNYRRVRMDYPYVRPRLYFIGALNRLGPLLIRDPYGLGPSAFDQSYRAIAAALRASSCSHPCPGESAPACQIKEPA